MIKKLKLAAEFLGVELLHMEGFSPQIKWKSEKIKKIIICFMVFNPQEKKGRHWLVEIWDKFDDDQWGEYYWKMWKLWKKQFKGQSDSIDYARWSQTAPSDICFDCICEVLGGK